MSSTLNDHYEQKVRPCIDLIDSLRSLGVEEDLNLPAIAVIGDQSSGKSSVLEALSGVALPRGNGIVTRCPLELKMKRCSEEDAWYGRISYQDYQEEIFDPAEVEMKIREAQDQMAGVGVGISEELISLEISSADVPDLTLIDLPGIARVAVNGQPEDIGDQIKRLIRKFITKQETINLVVVPCNVDIATTEALKMAQEEDPDGQRTLGILTKPDLADKGTEDTVVKIVHNEVINLRKGYMIVRCRGQQEIMDRVSLREATETEKAFFKSNQHFRMLYQEDKATIPRLAEKLTLELVNHIEKSLPLLIEQVDIKLAENEAELKKFGTGPPTEPLECSNFLIDKITTFTQDIMNLTLGEDLNSGLHLNLFYILRSGFKSWKDHLECSGHSFTRWMAQETNDFEVKYRGRELPHFINYKTFEGMMREQIQNLEEPAIKKMRELSEHIRKAFTEVAQNNFVAFPNLFKAAKTTIDNIKQKKEDEAAANLKTQFKMELIVYTQDSTYTESLMALKHTEQPITFLDNHGTLKYLMQNLKTYYGIMSRRVADQVPLVIRYHLLQEAALQLRREMHQLIRDKDAIEYLLNEENNISVRRANLLSRQKRLMQARNNLHMF